MPTASISDPQTLYNADPESRLQWALFGSGYRGKIIKQESFKKKFQSVTNYTAKSCKLNCDLVLNFLF